MKAEHQPLREGLVRPKAGSEGRRAEARAIESVADAVIAAVLRGEHLPGSRLIERQIVEGFGGTHSSARGVIRDLERRGAVKIVQRRGARIFGPADASREEMQAVWAALLAVMTGLAKEQLPPVPEGPLVERHRRLVSDMERLGRLSGDPRLTRLLQRVALQRSIAWGKAP